MKLLLLLFFILAWNIPAHATPSASNLAAALGAAQDEALNFKNEKAISLIQNALVSFEQTDPSLADTSKLPDAYLFIASCNRNLGRQKEMEKALEKAARLSPHFSPDEALFPPSLIAAFEKAKDRLWSTEHFTSLLVDSEPAGARIFINGVYRGNAPLRLDHQPLGLHHLHALFEGKEAYKKIILNEDIPARVSFQMGKARHGSHHH